MIPFPNPFLDLTDLYLPRTIEEILKYSKIFCTTNPMVSAAVYKQASYPITDIEIEGGSKDVNEYYKTLLEEDLDIKSILLNMGLDYFTYGNQFTSVRPHIDRFVTCPRCGATIQVSNLRQITIRGYKEIEFACTSSPCKNKSTVTVKEMEEIKSADPKKLHIFRWDPMQIEIKYSPFTGETCYSQKMGRNLRNSLRNDPHLINSADPVFIEAVMSKDMWPNDVRVEINKSEILHLRRPSPSMEYPGWGMPFVMAVMKDLYYQQMLKKAQQNIAASALNIMRILFPQSSNEDQPISSLLDLSSTSDTIRDEYEKWLRDPTYTPVFPFPVGSQVIGGEGRSLLLSPEIEEANKTIIAGMLVPQEFIYGGLTWSGSSVSLRMLENDLINYRSTILAVLKKVVTTISKLSNKPIPKVSFTSFRMADDLQRKQLIASAYPSVVSLTTVLKELDLDPEEELKKKQEEIDSIIDLETRRGAISYLSQIKASEMAQKAAVKIDQMADLPIPFSIIRSTAGNLPEDASNVLPPVDLQSL